MSFGHLYISTYLLEQLHKFFNVKRSIFGDHEVRLVLKRKGFFLGEKATSLTSERTHKNIDVVVFT